MPRDAETPELPSPPRLAAWGVSASVALGALAVVSSVGGIAVEGLYRDNPLVRAGWLGNDLVTLILAVPLLVATTRAASRGSPAGYLAWLGVLDYFLYNFAFYLFGAAFNAMFLVYAGSFALALYALVAGLLSVDPARDRRVARARPSRWVAAWMGFVALFLGGFWVAVSLPFVWTGEPPAQVTAFGGPTNLIGALDLTMVVPANALGAWWVARRNPWGVVVGTIVNVKAAAYMAALAAATWTATAAGVTDGTAQIGLWGGLGIGCLLAAAGLLRSVGRAA